jgi:alcohol dehydrogenase class IV
MAKTSEHSTDQVAQPNANIEQTLELRKYVAPEIIIGKDARLLLCRYLQHFTARRPMIVTDGHLLDLPWFQEILEQISGCTEDHFIFIDISPNPRDYETMLGADLFIAQKCDVIIAIGGGSPRTVQKHRHCSFKWRQHSRLRGCRSDQAARSASFLYSLYRRHFCDVSQFANICDTLSQVKKAIISKKVVPDLA